MIIRTMNRFCSPVNIHQSQCFSPKALKQITNIWNSISTSKINDSSSYKAINEKFKKSCGNNKYWLWLHHIEIYAVKKITNPKKLQSIKWKLHFIAKKELKPEKPLAWYKNPNTWLSNYDIQNVMEQYSDSKIYKYVFLGAFPIDFSVINNGVCMYSRFCNISISDYTKKCKKFIGFITNLDKHDQPGSHWTSTFIVIDPKLPAYGAYYYDSIGNSIPSYVDNFLKDIKAQCEKLYPKVPFNIVKNNKQHQFKNTECGVFSMLFQIRWLNKHIIKKNKTSFEEIIKNPFINDSKMLEIRDALYRPNVRAI